MAENFNATSNKRQAWSLSELKETYIDIFQSHIRARMAWLQALNGFADPILCKNDFVASLDAYYQVSQATFISFLSDMIDKEKFKTIKEQYDMLGIKGMTYDNDTLYQMSNYLTEWNTKEGYMRLNDTVVEWKDPWSKIEYLEQNR